MRRLFDVGIFNLFAPSYRKSTLNATYRKHEGLKKQHTDSVQWMSTMALLHPCFFLSVMVLVRRQTNLTRLASLLSMKWDHPYSVIIGWIRCCLSFFLLCTYIMIIRGTRSSGGFTTNCACFFSNGSLVCFESRLTSCNYIQIFLIIIITSLTLVDCFLLCLYCVAFFFALCD